MNVKVDDIMIDRPVVITPHKSVAHAKQLMRDHHISSLPVVGPEGEAVGVVSASDLLKELPDEKPVSQIMTRKVFSVPRYEDVHVAARVMRNHRIHHLTVTHEGKVVGMLSAYDLLSLVEDHRFVRKQGATPSTRRKPRRA
ncbi:MAG: CBS domain-containing protein [Deltaproteobacteria bacterium]|nr:CBS domain-containing protein [Deltaproteobacteria bacterium]MBW2359634.1 CBS domain-containing protein [Deltaproteobacteria bacterium]